MNTNTRRAATLTAALVIAGALAACGGGSGDATPSPSTEAEKWAAADAEKKAAIEAAIEACIASDQADPEVSAEEILGISSEQFCEESRAEDPMAFDIWYGPGSDAEKAEALERYADSVLEDE